MKHTFSLNSDLLPIINFGMYGSWLDLGERAYGYIHDDPDSNPFAEISDYDTGDYMDDLAGIAGDVISDAIRSSDYNVSRYGIAEINVSGHWSPRYYNYANDKLLLEVTIDTGGETVENWGQRVMDELREYECVEEYCRRVYRDGFGYHNFMPTYDELADFAACYARNNSRAVAAVLSCAMVREGLINNDGQPTLQGYYEERVLEDTYAGDYITIGYSIDEELAVLMEYEAETEELMHNVASITGYHHWSGHGNEIENFLRWADSECLSPDDLKNTELLTQMYAA